MAATKTQENANEATAATLTVTFAAATAGALLILCVYNSNFGITHTLTAGWTKAINQATSGVTNTAQWYKIAAGGETSVVVTASSGTPLIDAYVMEWAGMVGSSPVDGTPQPAGENADVSIAIPWVTLTTTVADTLIIAVGGHSGAINTTHAWDSGFTNLYSGGGTNHRLGVAYKILSATGSPQTTESWANGSRTNNGCMVAYKISTAAPKSLVFPPSRIQPVFMRR